MIEGRARAHWLRENEANRVPLTFVAVQCSTTTTETPTTRTERFAGVFWRMDKRRSRDGTWRDAQHGEASEPEAFWDWLLDAAPNGSRTVIVCHELTRQLRFLDALRTLSARGCEMKRIRLDRSQVHTVWKLGTRTLVFVDVGAWIIKPLDVIGRTIGLGRLVQGADATNPAVGDDVARRDVDIVAECNKRLVSWVISADLGNWQPSGAGQAWATFRHRHYTDRILVHDDERGLDAERRAAWTGRCEVWRHGEHIGGPFTEWDMTCAYATIGSECEVPTILAGYKGRISDAQYEKFTRVSAVLANVTVTTDVPTVPTERDGRILWPVGTFTTTLWDTEIALARSEGATVVLNEAWVYRKAPALESMCNWLLRMIDPNNTNVDDLVRLACKHWSRALIGRFGSRYSTWEPYGEAEPDAITLGSVLNGDTGERWRMLQMAGVTYRESELRESSESAPQVMSWVMAEARVRMWAIMRAAGLENVLYVDTDGLITDLAGSRNLRRAKLDGVRVKSEWRGVELLGPRQLVLSGRLRAAGVPTGSVRVSAQRWKGEVVGSLGAAIRASELDIVRATDRVYRVSGVDFRRRHLADGLTHPQVLSV